MSLSANLSVQSVASASLTAGTLWTPSLLKEKVTNWYDAKDAGSLTLTGSTVTEWRDKSGKGRHLNTDISTSDRPVYGATTFNGFPGLDYSSSKFQETNQLQGISGEYVVTFFMAHQWGTTGAAFGRMWTHGYNPQADGLSYLRGAASTDVYLSLEDFQEYSYYSSVTTAAKISSGGKLSTTPPSYKLWHDGTLLTKTSEGSDGTQNTTNTTLKINAGGSYEARNDQIIGEMVFCFGYALSDAERETVEGYLAHRWALAGALPSGHPFKLAAPTFVSLAGSLVSESSAHASEAQASVHFHAAGPLFNSDVGGTVNLPAGVLQDDVLFLAVETANQAVSVSSPAGWSQIAGSPQGTGTGAGTASTRLTVFWKRHVTGDESPVISDSGNHQSAQILSFRNAATTGNPWDVTAGSVNATASVDVSVPGLTTTVADVLIVDIVAHGIDTAAADRVTGFDNTSVIGLQKISDVSGIAGNGGGIAAAISRKLAAGSVNATTAVLASAFQQGNLKIALKASAGAQQQDLAGDQFVIASTTGALSVGKPVAGSGAVPAETTGAITVGKPVAVSVAALASTTGALAISKPLAGSALSDVQPVTPALSLTKPLAASAVNLVTVTGAFAEPALSGNGLTLVTATGSLSKSVGLVGSALSDVQAITAPLSVAKPLAATSQSLATGAAGLSLSVPLAGSGAALAFASADLGKAIPLAGSGLTVAMATAGLTKAVGLSGGALGVSTASADLARTATLVGAATGVVSAQSSFAGDASLAASAQAQAQATAALSTSVPLSAVAATAASTSANLSVSSVVALFGDAASILSAAASASVAKPVGGPVLSIVSASGALTAVTIPATGRIAMKITPVTLVVEATAETTTESAIRFVA